MWFSVPDLASVVSTEPFNLKCEFASHHHPIAWLAENMEGLPRFQGTDASSQETETH